MPKHGFSAAAVRLACSDLDVSPAFAGAAAAECTGEPSLLNSFAVAVREMLA